MVLAPREMRVGLGVCLSELVLLREWCSIGKKILKLSGMHLLPLNLQRSRQVSTSTS